MKKSLAALSFMMVATCAQATTTVKSCFIHLPQNKMFVNVNQIQRITYDKNVVFVRVADHTESIATTNSLKTAREIMAAINNCMY